MQTMSLARLLLLVGAVVLAALIGFLLGRGQRAEPTSTPQAVQITTTSPAPPAPAAPLPAPVQTPKAPPPRLELDAQVAEDAAAVGMTTRESEYEAPPETAPPAHIEPPPAE